MQIQKEYMEHNGILLKVEVYYEKGGRSYLSGGWTKRGYYLSVIPVHRKVTNGVIYETITAYSGAKMLLKEVKRQNKKAESEAIALAREKMDMLIQHVLLQHQIQAI